MFLVRAKIVSETVQFHLTQATDSNLRKRKLTPTNFL